MSRKSSVPGTFKNQPDAPVRDPSAAAWRIEEMQRAHGALSTEVYRMGECSLILARELYGGAGARWHLSVAHPRRYPTWDELKTAVYSLEPLRTVTMAQVLGPVGPGDWVNVHDNCFHLYEIHDPAWLDAGKTNAR